MNIGLIGLDTSHSEIFTRLLNDTKDPNHVIGGTITHALPIFSKDLPISLNRFPQYRSIVENQYHVSIVNDINYFMDQVDAIILGTVDGRNHLEWLQMIIPYGKPIFVDKPIVINSKEMREVVRLATKYKTPIMSTSSLRYAESVKKIRSTGLTGIVSGYFYGPLPLENVMPGYFWYGIHTIEMLVSLFGVNVRLIDRIKTFDEASFETIKLLFDNQIEIIFRGDYNWHNRFGGVLHYDDKVETFQLWMESRPYYANLLEEMILFFKTGDSPISLSETAQIIKLLEEINNHHI